jgi:hypothetical protein
MPDESLRFPYRHELSMPVIGLEAEFKPYVDGRAVEPETYWRTPAAFIERPLLQRSSKASQLPTGGAVYFDGGVVEVVTPVIEIAPQCTARVVRSLWEQIGFVRDQFDRWEARNGKRVRLEAFSLHFNISYELPREERNRNRTIQKLALLLAHLLPVPVLAVGANRRSTGLGVRPRRDRIEITFDFIPDPGLMAAATALIVGIVRDVIGWPSYLLTELAALPAVPGITPRKHPTRNGWVVRDLTSRIDPPMRETALALATAFRDSIRRYSDPFSYRILFSVLRGETRSLLDLPDRPPAYDDVGRDVRWGSAIPELDNYAAAMADSDDSDARPPRRRRADVEEKLSPPWRGEGSDRRERVTMPPRLQRRDSPDRRRDAPAPPAPRLTRSAYERVFLRLAAGKQLKIGRDVLTPVGVKGWYHAVFRDAKGGERLLSIDQVLENM